MSLLKIKNNFYSLAIILIFSSQLISTSSFANDEYFMALNSIIAAPHSKIIIQNQPSESKYNNHQPEKGNIHIDKEVRDEFETNLFKTTSQNFESYLDLKKIEQKEVIAIYSDKNSMESALKKLHELSDNY